MSQLNKQPCRRELALSSGRGLSFPQRDHIIGQRNINKPQTKGTIRSSRLVGVTRRKIMAP
jgi:hypothetical protein